MCPHYETNVSCHWTTNDGMDSLKDQTYAIGVMASNALGREFSGTQFVSPKLKGTNFFDVLILDFLMC